jgi:hypothetical protein
MDTQCTLPQLTRGKVNPAEELGTRGHFRPVPTWRLSPGGPLLILERSRTLVTSLTCSPAGFLLTSTLHDSRLRLPSSDQANEDPPG